MTNEQLKKQILEILRSHEKSMKTAYDKNYDTYEVELDSINEILELIQPKEENPFGSQSKILGMYEQ